MRDLDGFRTALRERADALPATPLLPGVRTRARDLQRRRLAGAAAAMVVVLAVVSGVGYLALSQSSKTLPAGAVKPDLDPADLVGPTWYLVSWTTAAGAVVKPSTGTPPTLIFDSQTAAHSDDTVNTTSWTVGLRKGTAFGVEGPMTRAGETAGAQAAYEALTGVLTGESSWKITGSELVIRGVSGRSVTYSRTPVSATGSASALGSFIDRVWYLTSWTTAGVTTFPATDSLPTLAFHDANNAITDVSGDWTRWSTSVGPHSLTASKGKTDSPAVPGPTAEAYNALIALQGTSTWRMSGTRLVVVAADGITLTMYSDPSAAPAGQVAVRLSARHGAGLVTRGPGPVPGSVLLTAKNGRQTLGGTVVATGTTLGTLTPGRYTATATIKDGVCTPSSVVVRSGRTVSLTMSCRDGVSTD